VIGCIDMNNSPLAMIENIQSKQKLEANGRHDEQVDSGRSRRRC
jgi:hypothetical protein